MKRLIIMAALILAAIAPMRAQKWVFRTLDADELRGTSADSVAIFDTEKYSVMVSFTKTEIWIMSKDCIFDYHKNEYWVMIGMYDDNDSLMSKDKQFCYYPNANSYTLVNIRNTKHMRRNHAGDTIVTRIIKHLNGGQGYVRIIAPMYQCASLDIILPTFGSTISTTVQQNGKTSP